MLIYPAIDIRGGQCVRLVQGDYSRETVFAADPVTVAMQWFEQGAERLHMVDLDGAKAGRPINENIIRSIVKSVPIPCQLGGGLRTDDDLARVMDWGVRWAVIGTKACQSPEWLCQRADQYPDHIVLGIDARNGFVATEGWVSTSKIQATELVQRMDGTPLAAIVYTDISRDGMLTGPNYSALHELQNITAIPVIASGGISTLEHIHRLSADKVYGCIIGRALYEGHLSLADVLAVTRSRA